MHYHIVVFVYTDMYMYMYTDLMVVFPCADARQFVPGGNRIHKGTFRVCVYVLLCSSAFVPGRNRIHKGTFFVRFYVCMHVCM